MVESSGSIPGAISCPGPALLGPDGASKSIQELRELFKNKGLDLDKPMAFSCGAGILATFTEACAEKAGAQGQRFLFDGSFTEYKAKSQGQ